MRSTPLRFPWAARAAALAAALASCSALPIPVAAQHPARPTTLEPYVSRARLAPAVVGEPARVRGVGARLLYRVAAGPLADRLHVGGFVTHTPADGAALSTTQAGAVADLRLTRRAIGGRVEPLLSLGVGAFRARHGGAAAVPLCFRPLDAPGARPSCAPLPAPRGETGTRPALSPALGARVAVLPGLAFRADARDLVVYRGGRPTHTFELTTGVSLTR